MKTFNIDVSIDGKTEKVTVEAADAEDAIRKITARCLDRDESSITLKPKHVH